MKANNLLKMILTAGMLESVPVGYADMAGSPVSVEISNNYTPAPTNGHSTWVLGSAMAGYADSAYSPIFEENFNNYAPGPLIGQGQGVWEPSIWGDLSPVVSQGRDKHLQGDITRRGATAATCFFPDIFADGNNAGRIEFDFRRGILELDILVGPSTSTNGVAWYMDAQSVGGQFSCYNGGCFTPRYRGGYNNPQIIYRPWQPGTSYHLVMDLAKTGVVVTVTTKIDDIPLENLSGIVFTNTAPQGINSLTIRGADYMTPICAVDNIRVSVPSQPGGMPPLLHTSGAP